MIASVFHFIAFAVLAAGLVLSAVLCITLAVVLTTSGGGGGRRRGATVRSRIFARTPHFDLAIDG